MNKRIRHLVLNAKNEPQRPCDFGLHLPGVQSAKSPSFTDAGVARLFAQKLAEMNKGENYYLASVSAGVTAYDVLDATPGEGSKVEWVDATADAPDAE